MKYEAKIQGNNDGSQTYSSSFVPESRAAGTPWVNISQTNAIAECASLGSGYHLITNAEWTSLARHIAAQPSNWSTGTVGSGVLSRGYSASTTNATDGFTNTVVASNTGINYEYNIGADQVGGSGLFDLKRTYYLANGKTLWDLAGNVWEWTTDICDSNWYNGGAWIEWGNANLSDYEIGLAGPTPLYESVQNAGMYWGCANDGNGIRRGGRWDNGLLSGIFAVNNNDAPSVYGINVGFRCVR